MKSKQIHFPFTLTNTHTKKRCWTDAKRFYRLSEFIFVCFFFLFLFKTLIWFHLPFCSSCSFNTFNAKTTRGLCCVSAGGA